MEVRAQARYVRIAPRKVRIVTDLVKGKGTDEAIALLRYTPKRAVGMLSKLLRSAIANAGNNHEMDTSNLYVYQVYVDEGPTLKRFRPRAMGRASRIRKRTSHITIILKEREE